MKPVIPIILLVLLSTKITFGQVKIGDNPQNIDPSSVLELESSSRVLVITRVSSQEMEAISPQRGGVVYNTDTECMHYYNGTNWINLCDATSFSLTNDPIENSNRTISLVDNGATINLEVALNSIRSENIVDGGINGDDIQDNSIGESKLGADSVGRDELRDNAVGSAQIIDGSITPGDMANTIPNQVLTTDINGAVIWEDSSNLRGAVADEVSITGGGTTANPLRLADVITDNIAANTTAITAHVSADGDTDNQNEVLTNAVLDGNELVLTESGVERRVDLGALNNAGTDNQTLNLTTGNILEIDGGNTVDLSNFLDNTDAQELELDGNTIRISGGNEITLPAGAVDTDDQDLTLAGTTLNITDGLGVDLNPLLVGAADGVVTGVALNGTSLDFTGADGGFNGSVSLATLGGGAGSSITNVSLTTTDTDADGTDDTLTLTDSAGNTVGLPLSEIDSNTTVTSLTTTDTDADGVDDALTLTDSDGNTIEIALADIENSVTNTALTLSDTNADGVDDSLSLTDSNGNVVNIALSEIDSNTVNTSLTATDTDADGIDDSLSLTDSDGNVISILLSAINSASDSDTTNTSLATSDSDANGIPDTLVLTDSEGNTVDIALNQIDSNTTNTAFSTTDTDADGIDDSLTLTDSEGGTTSILLESISSLVGTEGSIFFADTDGTPTEDTNQLFWNNTDNVLGVGTNTPDTSGTIKLHVVGSTRSGGFITSNGSAGTPSYRFNSDEDTGMYWGGGADQLGFSVGGNEALRIREEGTTDSELVVSGSLELTEQLIDENGNTGNSGDVLKATPTGTEWSEPSVVAMGKVNGGNSVNVNGVTVSGSGIAGTISVNFLIPRPDTDYIIQLTVVGDNRIFVTGQTVGNFNVEIRDRATNNLVVAEWFFTVLDF